MRKSLMVALTLLVLAGCTNSSTKPSAADPGALVRVTMYSRVGVVLDEIPQDMRARVTQSLLAKPTTFWVERAKTQVRLTGYRLNFRDSFYDNKGQLPMPPEPVRNVALVGKPSRRTEQGHDVVAVGYKLSSVLVTDTKSPAASEPKLKAVGGIWREPFNLPIDPELVMQRTGYACMDEADFPFNSVDSEETDSFYDQTVEVEKNLGNIGQAHFTRNAAESCLAAVKHHIGRVDTSVTFERIKWNAATASKFRYGDVTGKPADLQLFAPEFTTSRVIYRYIQANSCDTVEQSVGGTGWRRLMLFATSDQNVGETSLVIGGVDYNKDGKPQPVSTHNLYEFSPCHQHYHFKYYGALTWKGAGDAVNSKKGFCLQSTLRAANRETSPLPNEFGTCHYQGIAAGWIDEYKAGLPGQWLDITSFPPGPGVRSFRSNPNGFLCEGTLVDTKGQPLPAGHDPMWGPTGLTADNGQPVEAPLCNKSANWDANNADQIDETISPQGQGEITMPCERGQIGPLRNCGFGDTPTVAPCVAGQPTTATFSLAPGAAPQVVRVSEYSHALRSAIPARYEDSWVPLTPGVSDQPYMLGNAIVTANQPLVVNFTCPAPRTTGASEPGGEYSVYTAPVLPDDAAAVVSRS